MQQLFPKITRFIFFLLLTGTVAAQSKIEKLELKVKEAKTDSSKADALNGLAWECVNVDPAKGMANIEEAIAICMEHNYTKLKSSCYNTYAYLFEVSGNLAQAETYYKKSIEEKKKVNDAKGIATVYANIAKIYRRQSKYEEGVFFLQKSIAIQDSLKNYFGLGLAYNNLGAIYKDWGNNQQAKTYHLKALDYRVLVKDSIGMAYSYVNIGGVLYDLGEYKQGIEYTLLGLRILERKNDFPAIMLALSNVSSAYLKLKNITLAQKYNDRALNLALEKNNSNHLASIYQVRAEILMEKKDYKPALNLLKKGFYNAELNKQKLLQIEISANIGACLYHLKQGKEAVNYLKRAIAAAHENEIASIEFRSLCYLANICVDEQKLQAAQSHLKRAETLVRVLNSKKYYLTYYQSLIKLAKADKNNEQLLNAYDNYFLYRDSLMPENIHSAMSEASAKYESEKKEREIQLLRQQKKIDELELKEKSLEVKNRNMMLIFIALTIVLLAVLLYFYIKKQQLAAKQKREKAVLETQEKERSRIAKDIHDDLGSGLSKIRFVTDSLNQDTSQADFSRKIASVNQTAYQLVDNMRDLIWTLNPENNTLENLVIRIREYISDYFDDTNINCTIQVPEQIPEVKISNSGSRNLFSTIKEALQNTVKHSNSAKVELKIDFESDKLCIQIQDFGSGFDPKIIKAGNGLKNMQSRIESLGGIFSIQNKNGTRILMEIPLDQLAG